MSTWRDTLKRVTLPDGRRMIGASFRGVPFFVEDSERSGGRRAVVHEFPYRDDPYVDDMGRKARSFRVEGYILGDDYVAQRDALLVALEDTAGPGELVHPYHGVRRAVCGPVTVRESAREGGMAVVSMEFHEAPAQNVVATEQPDLAEQVETAAAAAHTAVEADLTATYSTCGLPSWAFEDSATYLQTVGDAIRDAIPVVGVELATQVAASLEVELGRIESEASSLARDPVEALEALRDAVLALVGTAEELPRSVIAGLLAVYGAEGPPLAAATTATRTLERANREALRAALRAAVAVEAARAITRVTYETFEDATTDREIVVAMLDEQADVAGDEAYPALVELRASVAIAVPGNAELARVVTVTRNVPTPSLVLAYEMHGSVDGEADIVSRNAAPHPGFLAGELKVLSDA